MIYGGEYDRRARLLDERADPVGPDAAQVLLLKRDLVAVVMALRGVCALTGDECFRENAEAWERADRALREYERGGESVPEGPAGTALCRGGCGAWSSCQYCDECSKTAKCPHGNPPDCNDCLIEGDFAFDAGRES